MARMLLLLYAWHVTEKATGALVEPLLDPLDTCTDAIVPSEVRSIVLGLKISTELPIIVPAEGSGTTHHKVQICGWVTRTPSREQWNPDLPDHHNGPSHRPNYRSDQDFCRSITCRRYGRWGLSRRISSEPNGKNTCIEPLKRSLVKWWVRLAYARLSAK